MPTETPYAFELSSAITLANEAGAIIESIRNSGFIAESKEDEEPVTVADRSASNHIVNGLKSRFPADLIISEEDIPENLISPPARVWFIDPIDGTQDFIDGTDSYCVMIGLVVNNTPVLGVVYHPPSHQVLAGGVDLPATIRSPDASTPIQVSQVSQMEDAHLVSSRAHRPHDYDTLRDKLGIRKETQIGSLGLKLCSIANGEHDVYVNIKPLCKAWDTAAPEAILNAAGGRVTDAFGQPLDYSPGELRRKRGVIATNGLLHSATIERTKPFLRRKKTP